LSTDVNWKPELSVNTDSSGFKFTSDQSTVGVHALTSEEIWHHL